MKVVVLNQCTLSEAYDEIINAANDTWISNNINPNVKILNYYGSNSVFDDSVSVFDKRMVIGVPDYKIIQEDGSEKDSRGKKFILALEYCLNNLEFDYLYRMSCTSYLVVEWMYQFLMGQPREKLFDGSRNMYDYKYLFISGFHQYMSRDVVEFMVANKDRYLELEYLEDLATGYLLFHDLKYLEFDHDNMILTHMAHGDVYNYVSNFKYPIFNYRYRTGDHELFYELYDKIKLVL